MGKKFDKVYVNGNFFDRDEKTYFVGIKDGMITKCGSKQEMEEIDYDEFIDLKGQNIYPGFTDAHLHLIAYSQKKLYEVSLNDITSKKELAERVKSFIQEKNIKKGDWVIGSGWNQDLFEEKKFPDRYLLDEISIDHPIHLTRTCYHICVVNSKALEIAGIDEDTPSPEGGRIDKDQDNIPTGIIRENAMDLIFKFIPGIRNREIMKELIIKGCEDLARVGVSTVHTDDFPFVEDKKVLWEVFKELAKDKKLPIRVVLQLRATCVEDIIKYEEMGLKSYDQINQLLVGPIKIIADGSLGSRTAALKEPYEDDPKNYGLMLMNEKELDCLIYESFKRNFDIGIHAIGDQTMSTVLKCYEKYYNIYTKKDLRPSIIHCQIASKEILNKFKRLKVIANIQPIFMHTDWKIAESRIGKKRLEYSYCWRKYIDIGILCVGSSDAPIESFNPLYGIYTVVTRRDLNGFPEKGWIPEEKINIHEAICMFTKNAAYLSHEEDKKGSIEEGQYADFIILSHDLCKIDEDDIKNVIVKKTIVGGIER